MSVNTQMALEPQVIQPLPVARPTSDMAIAGFVCSLVGISLLGLIFSAIALPKTKTEQSGRGLAIAGLVIGLLGTIGWMLLFAMAFSTEPAVDSYDTYSHVVSAVG